MTELRRGNPMPDSGAGPADGPRLHSLRRSGRRWFGRGEWLALGIALALHAVAFAVLPGPWNSALQRAPEISLAVNLDRPTHLVEDQLKTAGVVAESGGALDSANPRVPPLKPARVQRNAELGHYPEKDTAKQSLDVVAALPPEKTAAQPTAEPDPAQIWAELSDKLELKPATQTEGDESGEDAPAEDADAQGGGEADEAAAGDAAVDPPAESPQPEAADLDTEAILRRYAAAVKQRILAEKFYPAAAERLNQSGTVRVGFVIAADGSVAGIYVKQGSGYAELDKAAQEAVRRAGKFPAIPRELARESLGMSVALKYSLR